MKEGTDYKYIYKKDESPHERLRNKLSFLFTVIDIFKPKEKQSEIDSVKKDIQDLLTDAENHCK